MVIFVNCIQRMAIRGRYNHLFCCLVAAISLQKSNARRAFLFFAFCSTHNCVAGCSCGFLFIARELSGGDRDHILNGSFLLLFSVFSWFYYRQTKCNYKMCIVVVVMYVGLHNNSGFMWKSLKVSGSLWLRP